MSKQPKSLRTISYYNDLWGARVYFFIGNPQEFVAYLKKRFKFDAS